MNVRINSWMEHLTVEVPGSRNAEDLGLPRKSSPLLELHEHHTSPIPPPPPSTIIRRDNILDGRPLPPSGNPLPPEFPPRLLQHPSTLRLPPVGQKLPHRPPRNPPGLPLRSRPLVQTIPLRSLRRPKNPIRQQRRRENRRQNSSHVVPQHLHPEAFQQEFESERASAG